MTTAGKNVRVAVYTRKSKDEGLDQEFSSLAAQREAVESYVASRRGEGWVAMPDRYDDGGFSGANTERPAFQKLLWDIAAGRVDTVAVYKIDRLSRSLLDFGRIMELKERGSPRSTVYPSTKRSIAGISTKTSFCTILCDNTLTKDRGRVCFNKNSAPKAVCRVQRDRAAMHCWR
jgi:hypothetical protein